MAVLPNTIWGDYEAAASVIRVIPTALTALSATVLGIYNYKGEHIRQGITYDALQGELAKFLSGAEPYYDSEDKNISAFIGNIRTIVGGELEAWRAQFQLQENAQIQVHPAKLP